MAERVSRGVDRFAQRQALTCLVFHLTNPAFIAIPLVLGVAWHSTASWGSARDALPLVRCAVGGCSKVTDNGPLARP